jgi:hypothetical protein
MAEVDYIFKMRLCSYPAIWNLINTLSLCIYSILSDNDGCSNQPHCYIISCLLLLSADGRSYVQATDNSIASAWDFSRMFLHNQ